MTIHLGETAALSAGPAAGSPRGGRLAYRLVKRALDVLLASAGILVLAIPLAWAALAVKRSSPGPVFFRQDRLGRNGRTFRILKLRTMRTGSDGPAVTAGGDARVTRVGRALRRSKLDELPQLWNVLVGDMSLVGPRPEVRRYAALFPADYARILTVRPGITDYAAIEFRDEETVLAASPAPEATYAQVVLPAKIRLYHRYLDERSLGTDLRLLLRTLTRLLT